jgi:hypothetical protein
MQSLVTIQCHKILKKKKFDSNIESIHIENVNQSLDQTRNGRN